jgi:ATP-dependent DNA helicase HFM1/MER3
MSNNDQVMKTPEGVKVMINTDIGFINQKIPESFGSKLVYVCMLAETSDGRMVHFARIRRVLLHLDAFECVC